MISKSIHSDFSDQRSVVAYSGTLDERRQQIKQSMQRCRAATLALFSSIDANTFCHQAHPEFSPVGWHLGHIAYTESLWLLEHCAGLAPFFPQYRRLFAADGLPKTERGKLPTQEEIYHYLETVRNEVFNYLEIAPLEEQERLWRFILQHESQHCETATLVLQLQRSRGERESGRRGELPITHYPLPTTHHPSPITDSQMVEIPADEFEMGNDSLDALDNERPVHRVFLDTYWIDRYPVTCSQYRAFIVAGGYQKPEWWSEAGWKWLQDNPVTQPLYWTDDPAWDTHPVCGVSWYEAEAYTRFVGKRLPTEAEWEKAASWDAENQRRCTYPWGKVAADASRCNHDAINGQTTPVNAYPDGQSAYGCYDMLGNVWEWTASWFDGYDGFVSYPYAGYSKTYFDGQHRVLKGGSWATRLWAMRSSFRNWYHPGVRQIFAGFRCAR